VFPSSMPTARIVIDILKNSSVPACGKENQDFNEKERGRSSVIITVTTQGGF